MRRLWFYNDADPEARLAFECPGCGQLHAIPTTGARAWAFNGDMVRPTFSPSILVRYTRGVDPTPLVCHSFVRDGQIQFLGDCTHTLAGKTVPLPEVE